MAVAIEVVTRTGSHRRCDGVCHQANPETTCSCVCGGAFHGRAPTSWEEIEAHRQKIDLAEYEHVQLRFGA